MADKIDMSLDDIIKSNKKPKFQNKPKNANKVTRNGPGPVRNRNFNRRSGPYTSPLQNKTTDKWKHDLFEGTNKPTRLMIGNLHFRVTDQDIKQLFADFGVIKKAAVHYDKSGRSLGNAEVVYANRKSAIKAQEKYNDVLLDGRKMKITIVEEKKVNSNTFGRLQNVGKISQGDFKVKNKKRKNRLNLSNRPVGVVKSRRQPPPTQEELDADLDAYVNKN